MGRGIGLGCEQCDFTATLYERQPFALDASGQLRVLASAETGVPTGYWSDSLCGSCRLPVRVTLNGSQLAQAVEAPNCPHCGAAALTFEQATRELAEASHSRAWLDLHREQEAGGRLEAALMDITQLQNSIASGDMTTPEALDALAALLAPTSGTISATVALDGIGTLLENALDLDAATQLLKVRLQESQSHVGGLQLVAEDEAYLPGVPCPQCHTGHLIHWPIWE